MSTYFRKNNAETTMRLYYKNIMYKDTFFQAAGNRHIVDFNWQEKMLFGRIDPYHMPMVLKQSSLQSVFDYATLVSPVKVVSFVAAAFNDLVQHFKRAAITGQINGDDPYLGTLVAYKGYENPRIRYNDYRNSWHQTLAKKFRNNNNKIIDFSDLIESLKQTLIFQDKLVRHPWTYAAYVKSRLCPIACSGLAIEIADVEKLSCSDDTKKVSSFFTSPNWEFYVNACNNYGFMIDMNAPWRIVADIDSEGMKKYATGRTTQQIIKDNYIYAYPGSFNSFDQELLNLYNLCRNDNYMEPANCSSGQNNVKFTQSAIYTLDQIQNKFSDEFFIELWLTFRFAEEESFFTESEKNKMIRRVISFYKAGDLDAGLFSFERILNKPFDYVGSMTYNSKALAARSTAAETEGETSGANSSSTGGGGY